MADNNENVEPNGSSNNSNAYLRKISAQAETDEKPIGRVKDMQRFLMDFEAKNKADAKRHDFPQKVKDNQKNALRPWEKKKQHQEEDQKEMVVEEEEPKEEPKEEAKQVAEDSVDPKQDDIVEEGEEEQQQHPVSEPKGKEPAIEEVEDDAVDAGNNDGDDDASLDDFEQVARDPSTPETSSQYTRIISKQAEADERPLESVSELKQWLMQSAPGTDKKNKTLAAIAASERERAERKLINELSKRMTRDEAVKTARSYLRRISDQAVCEELPLMHVSEAQQFLMDFERKNKEHFEKHSVKQPNKRLGRCSGAAELHVCEDKIDEEDVQEEERKQPDENTGLQQDSVVEEVESDEEAKASETSFDEKKGLVDLDESTSLEISIDDGIAEEEETVEMEQPSIDGDETSDLTDSKLVQEKEDNFLDDAVKDFAAGIDNEATLNIKPTDQTQQHNQLEQPSFVITYDKSSRSLISDATSSAVDDESKAAGADASDVFRKRYLTDVNQEKDEEEVDRPKKLRRGLDLLKCLACPNPVKVVLNGGGGSSTNGDDSKFEKLKKMMPKNPTVTMTSSADHEDIAASRRNLLGAGAVAPGGYEALESPSNSEITLESAAMTANGIYGIKHQPSQFRNFSNNSSPANTNFSGSSDGLPKDNALTTVDIKSTNGSVLPDHLRFLEQTYQTDQGDLHEC